VVSPVAWFSDYAHRDGPKHVHFSWLKRVYFIFGKVDNLNIIQLTDKQWLMSLFLIRFWPSDTLPDIGSISHFSSTDPCAEWCRCQKRAVNHYKIYMKLRVVRHSPNFNVIAWIFILELPYYAYYSCDYKMFKQATGTMILLVYVGSIVI